MNSLSNSLTIFLVTEIVFCLYLSISHYVSQRHMLTDILFCFLIRGVIDKSIDKESNCRINNGINLYNSLSSLCVIIHENASHFVQKSHLTHFNVLREIACGWGRDWGLST